MLLPTLRTAEETRENLHQIKGRAELLKVVQSFLLKASAYPTQPGVALDAYSPATQSTRMAILLANEIGFSTAFLGAVQQDKDLYQAFLSDLATCAWVSNAQHPLNKSPLKDDLLEVMDAVQEHALYIPDIESFQIQNLTDVYDFLSSHFSAYAHEAIESVDRRYSVMAEFQATKRESLDHLGVTQMRAAVLDQGKEIFVAKGHLLDGDPDIEVADFYRQMDQYSPELADIAHALLTEFLEHGEEHRWTSIGQLFSHPSGDQPQGILVLDHLQGDDEWMEEPLLRLLLDALPGLLREFNRLNLENGFVSCAASPDSPERLHKSADNRVPHLFYPMKLRGLNLVTIRNPIVFLAEILDICEPGPERDDVIDGATLSYIEIRNAFDDINEASGDNHNGGKSPDPDGLRPFYWVCNEPPAKDGSVIQGRRCQHYSINDDADGLDEIDEFDDVDELDVFNEEPD